MRKYLVDRICLSSESSQHVYTINIGKIPLLNEKKNEDRDLQDIEENSLF